MGKEPRDMPTTAARTNTEEIHSPEKRKKKKSEKKKKKKRDRRNDEAETERKKKKKKNSDDNDPLPHQKEESNITKSDENDGTIIIKPLTETQTPSDDKKQQCDDNDDADNQVVMLERAYKVALQAYKKDKTNKDLRRAKTAAKQAWDASVIAAAEPGAVPITCRNCSQLFLFNDFQNFQDRGWVQPTQCKQCVGNTILQSQDRAKVDKRQNMCYEFQKSGSCSRGERCKFSHATDHVGKKKAIRAICHAFEKGEACPHGEKCRFRHSKE